MLRIILRLPFLLEWHSKQRINLDWELTMNYTQTDDHFDHCADFYNSLSILYASCFVYDTSTIA